MRSFQSKRPEPADSRQGGSVAVRLHAQVFPLQHRDGSGAAQQRRRNRPYPTSRAQIHPDGGRQLGPGFGPMWTETVPQIDQLMGHRHRYCGPPRSRRASGCSSGHVVGDLDEGLGSGRSRCSRGCGRYSQDPMAEGGENKIPSCATCFSFDAVLFDQPSWVVAAAVAETGRTTTSRRARRWARGRAGRRAGARWVGARVILGSVLARSCR
jgi:hypothetical protein